MNKPPTLTSRVKRMVVGETIEVPDKTLTQSMTAVWRISKENSTRFIITEADGVVRITRAT